MGLVAQQVDNVNEGNAVTVTFELLDSALAPSTPDSAKYRIDDPISGRAILGWTSISSPTDTVEISITGAQNALDPAGDGATDEARQVTLQSVYGSEARYDALRYELIASPFYAYGD